MQIEEEYLRDLLGRAYQAGWFGVIELKDSAVEDLLEEARNVPLTDYPIEATLATDRRDTIPIPTIIDVATQRFDTDMPSFRLEVPRLEIPPEITIQWTGDG